MSQLAAVPATDRAVSTTAVTPAVSRPSKAAAIAECVASILEGRALPEAWRPAPVAAASAPRTIEEGITRILNGRAR